MPRWADFSLTTTWIGRIKKEIPIVAKEVENLAFVASGVTLLTVAGCGMIEGISFSLSTSKPLFDYIMLDTSQVSGLAMNTVSKVANIGLGLLTGIPIAAVGAVLGIVSGGVGMIAATSPWTLAKVIRKRLSSE